jgi:hypothetical protein
VPRGQGDFFPVCRRHNNTKITAVFEQRVGKKIILKNKKKIIRNVVGIRVPQPQTARTHDPPFAATMSGQDPSASSGITVPHEQHIGTSTGARLFLNKKFI